MSVSWKLAQREHVHFFDATCYVCHVTTRFDLGKYHARITAEIIAGRPSEMDLS